MNENENEHIKHDTHDAKEGEKDVEMRIKCPSI